MVHSGSWTTDRERDMLYMYYLGFISVCVLASLARDLFFILTVAITMHVSACAYACV